VTLFPTQRHCSQCIHSRFGQGRLQAEVVGMVWCFFHPPSVCSVTEGGGVMQRPSGHPRVSRVTVSNADRQCNPRLFGDGFVPVTHCCPIKTRTLLPSAFRTRRAKAPQPSPASPSLCGVRALPGLRTGLTRSVTLAIEKEWNRGCLHLMKSSGMSLRCTCLVASNEVAGRPAAA
jgi:hypothetical protein